MTYKTFTQRLAPAMAVAVLVASAHPVLASHANPWAEEDDEVLSQYHDENQAVSEDTPGEDEMNGVMTRSAHGKLGTAGSDTGQGSGGGHSADAGGAGNGGGGHGGGIGGGGQGGAGNGGGGAGNGGGGNGGGAGNGGGHGGGHGGGRG